MMKRVLIPLDGSELAEQVLPHLLRFVFPQQTEILLVAALPPSLPALSDFGQPSLEQILALSGQQITGSMQNCTQALNQLGYQTSHFYRLGTPADTILSLAEEEHCDLIAMSTHGRTGIGRALLGSVSDQVVRNAHQPVFLVPGSARVQSEASPQTIMLPLDGSHFAETAIPLAQELARTTNASIHLVRAIDSANQNEPKLTFGNEEGQPSKNLPATQPAITYLEQIRLRLQLAGVSATYQVIHDDAATGIVQVANAEKIDLIAMSTHGRSGLERIVFGSVASQVIHNAPCPLLLTHGREVVEVSERVGNAVPVASSAG